MASDITASLSLMPRFGIGGLLSRSWRAMIDNFARFFLILLIPYLPALALGVALSHFMDLKPLGDADLAASLSPAQILVLGLLGIAVLMAYLLATGGISHGTLRYLAGGKAGIAESLQVAWRALPQMLGVASIWLVLVAGLEFAVLLLGFTMIEMETPANPAHISLGGLMPGALMVAIYVGVVVLFLRWWLAFAVIIGARPGVIASLARSASLTRGRHWSIFGAVLLVMLIIAAVGLSAALLGVIPVIGAAISLAVDFILAVFTTVIPAVGYCLLRLEKEGTEMRNAA